LSRRNLEIFAERLVGCLHAQLFVKNQQRRDGLDHSFGIVARGQQLILEQEGFLEFQPFISAHALQISLRMSVKPAAN